MNRATVHWQRYFPMMGPSATPRRTSHCSNGRPGTRRLITAPSAGPRGSALHSRCVCDTRLYLRFSTWLLWIKKPVVLTICSLQSETAGPGSTVVAYGETLLALPKAGASSVGHPNPRKTGTPPRVCTSLGYPWPVMAQSRTVRPNSPRQARRRCRGNSSEVRPRANQTPEAQPVPKRSGP